MDRPPSVGWIHENLAKSSRLGQFSCLFEPVSPAARAQYRAGVQGVVLDAQGASVEGATITLKNSTRIVSRRPPHGSAASTLFSSLPPGQLHRYGGKDGLQEEHPGKCIDRGRTNPGVKRHVGTRCGHLVGDRERVQSAPIDTETGQLSGTLSTGEVQNLPSFGRDPYQLLQLAPGVFGDDAHNNGGGSQNIPGSAGPGGSSATSSIFQTENQVQVFAERAAQRSKQLCRSTAFP